MSETEKLLQLDVVTPEGTVVSDQAEIVVPLFDAQNDAWGVLDVDSQKFDAFSATDKNWLEKIVQLISSTQSSSL